MKICTSCGTSQDISEFCRDASRPDGKHPHCRECRSNKGKAYYQKNKALFHAKTARWREKNIDAQREINKRAHQNNKEKRNADSKRYRQDNLEHMRYLGRQWSKSNPDKARKYSHARRVAKANAIPLWAKEEFEVFAIQEIFNLAVLRTKTTDVEWHVDHVVPLRSQRVCGLHCSANLQVITSAENHSKGNRHWPDM